LTEPRDPSVGDPSVDETEVPPSAGSPSPTRETELRTFLIADIRGYTTYTRERGDEAGAALAARFAELVAEVVTARDGVLIELRGDEALVMFVSARKALRAAIDLQARFTQAELPRGVGIGLDAGEAIPVGDGYRGTALNLAARLCAEAGPGETLASETVIHLAAKLDGIAYVDARALRLKGYTDAVRVVDVVPSDRTKGRRLASGRAGPGRARWAVAGLAVLLVVALAVGAVGFGLLQTGGTGSGPSPSIPQPTGSSSPSPSIAPSASPDPLAFDKLPLLAFYDGKTGELKETTPFPFPRNLSFFSNDAFWMMSDNPLSFNRLDPVKRTIDFSVPIGIVEASGFNFDDNSIWATDLGGPRIVRIDKRTLVPKTFEFGKDADDQSPASDIAIGEGSVWLARPDIGEVTRLDAETGEVQARIPVVANGISFGDGAAWYYAEGRIGRINPATNKPTFEPEIQLGTVGWLGNIYFGGGYAWTAETITGTVWRVDRSGRHTSVSLDPGTTEMAATDTTMWVTNQRTGELTGLDLVTGRPTHIINSGHATLTVSAGGDELMVAIGPTVEETIGVIEGSVLTIADSSAWLDPPPDPQVNGNWEVRVGLYLTCLQLVNYPDKPSPEGLTLQPEAAEGMPDISADGLTYTFRIKPGFMFSPPSNEPVTAETFRATLKRALDPVLPDDEAGPQTYGVIAGASEYRARTAPDISGLVANGDQLTITLSEPTPDFLGRLALSFACAVPARTQALRSGLDPHPPISGAGPYYIAQSIRRRLVVLKKNPNYDGPRAQPFDAIAIRLLTAPAEAIDQVQRGIVDAAILPPGEPLAGATSSIAAEWGPGSDNAAAGDQRWFGAAKQGLDYLALNMTRPAFSDPDVRRAVALAIDRTEISSIWINGPYSEMLPPGVEGATMPTPPMPSPDIEAALELMNGRTLDVTLQGYPVEWDCGPCRDYEQAITGQLRKIGITVTVRHPDDYPGNTWEPDSGVDMINWGTFTDLTDPGAFLRDVHDDAWLSAEDLAELERLEGLTGQARIDAAVAFANHLEGDALVIPLNYPVFPFYISERIGCGFVQPAIGAVDLLSLCVEEGGAGAAPSASPAP
jgi:ABC-type transport system substrate-binding protein/class 3 adenylate cyclase